MPGPREYRVAGSAVLSLTDPGRYAAAAEASGSTRSGRACALPRCVPAWQVQGMDIEERVMPAVRAAAADHEGPPDRLGATFAILGDWAMGHVDDLTGPPRVLYLNDPRTTPPEQRRSTVAIPVTGDVVIDEAAGVHELVLPGGRCVVGTHTGPYAQLGPAWVEFMAARQSEALEVDEARVPFEVYVSDPASTPEAELVTELCLPIT